VPSASAVETQCGVKNVRTGLSFATLKEAVEAATAGDTLDVKGTCEGDTALTKQLTIDGETPPNYGPATLQGRPTETEAVVRVIVNVPVTIAGLTITGATAGGSVGASNEGSLTLANSTVTGNFLGITNSGREASLTLTSSTVSNNQPNGGIENHEGRVTLTNSTVSGNTASPVGGAIWGGGIWTVDGGVVTLNGSTVTGNTAQGGGIFSRASSVTLNSSNVIGNTAIRGQLSEEQSGRGGGIFDASKSSLLLNGSSSVTQNMAQVIGGGIYVETSPRAGSTTLIQGHLTFGPGWNGTVSGNFPDNVFPPTCMSGC
jgi:hypothetical protein